MFIVYRVTAADGDARPDVDRESRRDGEASVWVQVDDVQSVRQPGRLA